MYLPNRNPYKVRETNIMGSGVLIFSFSTLIVLRTFPSIPTAHNFSLVLSVDSCISSLMSLCFLYLLSLSA